MKGGLIKRPESFNYLLEMSEYTCTTSDLSNIWLDLIVRGHFESAFSLEGAEGYNLIIPEVFL
jgi:hypothetical protein